MKKLILSLFFFVMTLCGLFLLVITFKTRLPSLGLLGEARKTTGTVVEINSMTESGESFQVPLVQFTAENGQQFSVDMICPPLDCYAEYGVGSQVPVIYPENFPQLAIADTFIGRLVTPLFMLFVGLMLTLPGPVYLAGIISNRRRRSTRSKKPKYNISSNFIN
jgi:hypothetical protein